MPSFCVRMMDGALLVECAQWGKYGEAFACKLSSATDFFTSVECWVAFTLLIRLGSAFPMFFLFICISCVGSRSRVLFFCQHEGLSDGDSLLVSHG